jgi:hypothetical protein
MKGGTMKKFYQCTVIVLIVAATVTAGLNFSVKTRTDFGLQAADFGFKIGRWQPYIGLDLFGIGASGNYTDIDYDADYYIDTITFQPVYTGLYKYREATFDAKGSAWIILPTLGIRVNLSEKDLSPYVYGSFFKALAFLDGDMTYKRRYYYSDGKLMREAIEEFKDGKSTYRSTSYNPDGSIADVDVDEEDLTEYINAIEGLLSPWGLGTGFGAEYKLNEHLVVFGEYGLKLYFFSSKFEDTRSEDYDDDGKDDWREEWKEEMSASIKMISAALGIRFCF